MRQRSEALSDQEIEIVAPAVFADAAHDEVSSKYNRIDTRLVLDGLRGEGWAPVWVNEAGVRDKSRAGYQKHMMRFRHVDSLGGHNVGDEFPEILLINSHDRSSSFQIHAALFRMICGNGMVVADTTFSKLRVRHLADANEVIEAALKVPVQVPQIMNQVNGMKAIELSPIQQTALARAAAVARWGDIEKAPIEPELLLKTKRAGDVGNDLWTTFNRVQENTIRGGTRYLDRKTWKRGTVREVKGIDQNTTLNKALWELAETHGAHATNGAPA